MIHPRKSFERFCYKHRSKGIPNLMLYIVLGNALVYFLSVFARNFVLYDLLCFNRAAILKGEVWRLFTYVFTSFTGSGFFDGSLLLFAISLICYYSLGRAMENTWGTLKFNLFYLTGIVLMDIFALSVSGIYAHVGDKIWDMSLLYAGMGTYLNMSLFLGYATLYPSAQFLLMFIIPVRAWIFALFDLAITFYDVFSMAEYFPHNLLPLVAIANYFLFFGKEVLNVIPVSWRVNLGRLFGRKPKTVKAKVVPFPSAGSYQATVATPKAPYTHKCVVCGKTDISDPDMEFRYCSRCKGYHCYCIDHINNHEHIEE